MAKIRLTAGRIKDFNCPSGKAQAFLWDSEVPGLGIRATAAGAKSFIFQAKLNGQTIRATIGDTGGWLLDNPDPAQPGARQEARRLVGLIDGGIDPRQEKQERIAASEAKREEARRQDVTVWEAWLKYIEERSPHWGELYRRDHTRMAQAGGSRLHEAAGRSAPPRNRAICFPL